MESPEEHLRDALRVAGMHLIKVGCEQPDPLTLALTVWPERDHSNQRIDHLDAAGRAEFTFVYRLACEELGFPESAPDFRPLSEREQDNIEALVQAYRFAGEALQSHANALDAETDRRAQSA
jgi:hypothetical protein